MFPYRNFTSAWIVLPRTANQSIRVVVSTLASTYSAMICVRLYRANRSCHAWNTLILLMVESGSHPFKVWMSHALGILSWVKVRRLLNIRMHKQIVNYKNYFRVVTSLYKQVSKVCAKKVLDRFQNIFFAGLQTPIFELINYTNTSYIQNLFNTAPLNNSRA
jgi:hypothetical protein